MRLIVFLLAIFGVYCLGTAAHPGVYAPAAQTLRKHMPRRLSQTEVVINFLTGLIQPRLDLDPIKRTRLAEELRSLNHDETPERFQARALARAIFLSSALLALIPLSPLFGAAFFVSCWALYASQGKKLQKEIQESKRRIERELPQFAGTIRQSLNSTHDVVAMLESYRKICGPTLREEIGRTLNDMKTGNAERALKAMESRVGSSELSQLTRGLIGVMRGDDQRMYFDMLTAQYRKAQDESVKQELLQRPEKLLPNMGVLFGCIALMLAVALGLYMKTQMGMYF